MTPEQQALSEQLTNLQRLTVLGVVSGKSYEDAYKDAKGLDELESPASARAIVSRMLTEANVKDFYDSLLEGIADDAILTRKQALERLTLMASTEITDILEFVTVDVKKVGKDGEEETEEETIWRMFDSPEVQRKARAAIKSVTMTKQGPKIEMYDARDAITQIAKMQGWDAPNKVQVSGDPDNPVVSVTLGKEEYKAARAEMMKNDDC